MNTSETPRDELERLQGNKLVTESFLVFEVLITSIEKEKGILEMVMGIGPPSKAWRALTRIETREAAYDRAKNEFESLEMLIVVVAVDSHIQRTRCLDETDL